MKTILLPIIYVTICLLSTNGYAQDILTKKDGTDIQAKVIEIGITEIKYKKFDNQNGPVFSLLKADLLMIRYENGTKDIFNQTNTSSNTQINNSPVNSSVENGEDMCTKGEFDANLNYTAKNSGAGWSTATTIIFSPIIGIIPTLICSTVSPIERNLKYHDQYLMKNSDYSRCYKQQALKTKKRKLWYSYAIGSGVWVLIIASAGN